MYEQVPLVEIDGLKLVQTRAIMNYISEKYNLHGKDLKDRAMYDLLHSPSILYYIVFNGRKKTSVTLYVCVLPFRINMYSEGLMDVMEMIMYLPFSSDLKPKLDNIQKKANERYLPVFEKVWKKGYSNNIM